MHRGWLVLFLGCGGPTPVAELPPGTGMYDGILIVDGVAEAAPTQFLAYTSEGACEAAEQIHVEGLCDLVLTPDAAGFVDLPAVDDAERPYTCRHRNRTWALAGGVVHVTRTDGDPAIRIAAGEACTVPTALGGPPDPVCENDVVYRLDLGLATDAIPGDLPCTLPGSPIPDGRCGPTEEPLACDDG
jgi:hypothetical protein